nr:hypothetical protein 10 [Paracoccaceae bacterium]
MRSIFAVLLSLFATGVFAEDTEDNKPAFSAANISVTETKLVDNAENGCWTNLRQSREYLDEQFKMNGYKQVTRGDEYGYLSKEEWTLVNRTIAKLPNEMAEYARYSAYLTMMQKNYYEPTISVLAYRNDFGRCYGFIQLSLNRWVASHHIEKSYVVEVNYNRQVFMNADNVNGIVLNMAKEFVKYLQTTAK